MNGLTLAQIGGVLQGVLAGLAHAEQHGIVHRDIKPENLLVTVGGDVKIADFGIAKATNAVDAGSLVTRAGLTVGTPNYIAPEQAMAHELGPWTDLYSVGITAFELLTGRTPFGDSKEAMAIVLRQINEPVRRVIELAPQAPVWLSDWVGWLTAKDPAQRPQAAARAWDALEGPLIATLGPRWTREAALRPPDDQPPRPDVDPRLAPTAPPRTARRSPTQATATPRTRRMPTWLKAAAAAATLVATAAVALAGGRGSTTPEVGASATGPTVQQPRTAAGPAPGAPSTGATLETRVAPAQKLARKYDRAAAQLAKKPNAAPKDAAAVDALHAAAQAYRDAAAAAARNDAAGYTAAVSAAAGAQHVSSTLTATEPSTTTKGTTATTGATTRKTPAAVPPPPTRSAPAATVTTTPSAPAPSGGSACAGDSTSDDPSDDECSGEP
jgi:hypothetical protein